MKHRYKYGMQELYDTDMKIQKYLKIIGYNMIIV